MAMKRTDYKQEIINLRHSTRLSQAEFSKEFGIPKRTIESWEMGVSSPREYNFYNLKERVERWLNEK